MSTTTERRRPWRALAAAGLVLAAWYAGLAALARLAEPTEEVIALVEPSRIAALLSAAPVRVVEVRGGLLHLRGEAPGHVAALYAAGARLVLPASRGGCRGAMRAAPGAQSPSGG